MFTFRRCVLLFILFYFIYTFRYQALFSKLCHYLPFEIDLNKFLEYRIKLLINSGTDDLPVFVIGLIVSLFSLFKLWGWCSRKEIRRKRVSAEVAYALRRVLLPAQSQWPPLYYQQIQTAAASGTSTITIPIQVLLDDIRCNRVQLRDSRRSLKELILYGKIMLGDDFTLELTNGCRLGLVYHCWKNDHEYSRSCGCLRLKHKVV